MALLEVRNLSVSFTQYSSGLRQKKLDVISNLNVTVEAGEIVAIVGASGSGKSLLAHAILGILPGNAAMNGTIVYDGEELTPARQAEVRGKHVALVPQSVNFLDPLMRVGKQVQTSVRSGDAVQKQKSIFERYRLAEKVGRMFPFQLSGGMARRTLVSMAMVSDARVLIADEPTPGLDPLVVREALQCFRESADRGAAVMMITHDIESALTIADRIAIFYAGTTVEIAKASDFAGDGEALRHPYTKALWRALPRNEFAPIPGSQPRLGALSGGCIFGAQCEFATPDCILERPEERSLRDGVVWCNHAS